MFRRISQWLLAISLLAVSFGSPFSNTLKWSYYETEHFRLYFTPETAAVANQAYDMVESIFSNVTKTLGYVPPDRVELIFTDQEDQVNAYAEYFTHVIVIEVSPISQSMLGPFRKQPLHNLITHELTHIVHLGMNYATPLVYRLTKRMSSKGILYPYFMIEGQAVYNEKHISQGGRLIGSAFEEQMMAFAKAKSFPSLSQITNRRMLRFPQGNGPYIVGAKFVDYLVNKYGRSQLMAIYHEFASESYLGGFENAFESVIKEPLSTVYQAFQDYQNLRFMNLTKIEDQNHQLQTGPVYRDELSWVSPNALVWYENDFRSPARQVIWPMQSTQSPSTLVTDQLLFGAAAIDNDSLYFMRFHQSDLYYSQQDLVRKTTKDETIIASHVNDYDVFEGAVLWIKSDKHREVLMLKSATSDIAVAVLTADSIASPLWFGVNDAFVAIRNSVDCKLIRLDTLTGLREDILNVSVRDLSRGPDNKVIIVADIEGLSQAFLLDPTSKVIKQMTHEVTGVYSPQWTGSELVYLTQTDQGRDLVSVIPDTRTVNVSELFLAEVPLGPTWNKEIVPTVDRRVLRTDLFKPTYSKTPHDYEPFSYNLLYFIPYLTFSSYGNYLGFNMMMSDPLQYQQVALTFMSNAGQDSYQVNYLNTWTYPFFSFQAKKQNNVETSTMELQLPWVWGGRNVQQFSLGLDHRKSVSENADYWKVSHTFQVGERYLYSISPEKTFQNAFSYLVRQSDQKVSFTDQVGVYLPGLGQNHVLYVNGIYARSETGVYSLGGFLNDLSVRGYAYNDIKQAAVVAKVGLEYIYPLGVVDDTTWFGLYGYQTYGKFFVDIGDAAASTSLLFGPDQYYSYGYIWGIKSLAANMFPLDLGIGLAHTGKAGTVILFSLGLSL